MKKLQEISVSQIYPHPKNPRKNLGDLTELTESIKTNGVLQNLTVVKTNEMDTYTVIIGHRRLEAAKAAGLDTVPCYVATLDKKEQLEMMLTENVQRSDLTLLEEADGMQMVLDLGVSVKELAKDTGLSETNIRSKVSILKNDRTKLENAQLRGGTLKDYMELGKIKDEADRAKVLDKIGTSDFNYNMNLAMDRQKAREWLEKAEERVQIFATFLPQGETGPAGIRYLKSYTPINKPSDIDIAPLGAVEYYYRKTEPYANSSYCCIGLYTKAETSEETGNAEEWKQDTARRQEIEERVETYKDRLAEIDARSRELREKFIKEYPERKIGAHITELLKFSLRMSIYGYTATESFCSITGLSTDPKKTYSCDPEKEGFEEYIKDHPEKALLMWAYVCAEETQETRNDGYWHERYDCPYFDIEYETNPELDELYQFMEELGYELSSDETDMVTGQLIEDMKADFAEDYPEEAEADEEARKEAEEDD